MHIADQQGTGTSATTLNDPSGTTSAGRISMTDSESEDLELSSWDSDASNQPINKRRKRRGRRENPTLGDRVVMDPPGGEGMVVSKEDRKLADAKVARDLAVNLCFIGLWYTFSLLISIYNKWMFDPKYLNFKFPLFVTSGHMLVQFSCASLVLFAFPNLRPANFPGSPQYNQHQHHHHSQHGTSTERQNQQDGRMTQWFYLTRITPCAAATGLDIGLGNMSLKFISLAFYTMCKSSSLAFVLIFAFIFRLEKPTWTLVAMISIMTLGVVMMVSSESEATFVLIGFILVITASALAGLRWSLTQVLLVRNPATSNPFSTIFFLAPMMFLAIFCVAVPIEGFGPLFARYGELIHEWGFIPATGILVCPGIIAFLMVSSEFALLQRSSVVTLSVAGIFKEIVTITAAAIIFGDKLTPVNITGLAITIVSIGWYNWWKIQKMRVDTLEETTHGGATSEAGYVAVGDQADEEGTESAEDEADAEEEERRRRRKRRVVKGKATKAKVKGKGKGKARTSQDGELLQKVDEDDEESERARSGDEDPTTVKRGVVSSGSGAKVTASAAAADTASLHGEVRLRSGSLSSVEVSQQQSSNTSTAASKKGSGGNELI